MSLKSIRVAESQKLTPVITVFGVGGAGCNAVQNMHTKNLEGVRFVIANTDAQSLANSSVETKIQLGLNTTQGLGAGSDPEIGRVSAEETEEQIRDELEGVHMVFITAGMGGGTGTGAAPVIAKIARDMNILTVGVVTKPFVFEGERRMSVAKAGIQEIRKAVHTTVIIPNQNLFQISNESTTAMEAFMKADDVLFEGVKSITDLMLRPGLVNLDFADVRTVMLQMGSAMMGTGIDSSEERAKKAALNAMNNQLLEDTRLDSAKAVLINVTGGEDLTLFDISQATTTISSGLSPDANVVPGSSRDKEYDGKIKVSLLAAGMESEEGYESLEATETENIESPVLEDELDDLANEEFDSDDSELNPVYEVYGKQFAADSHNWVEDNIELAKESKAHENSSKTYVAPYVDDGHVHTEVKPDTTPLLTDIQPYANESESEDKSSSWALISLINRMKSGLRQDEHKTSNDEPSLVSNNSQDNENDINDNRSLPAYMRRQAN